MKLFVFPLGQVLLLPGTTKPLNIFEPRYLQMIQDAQAEKTPIALGFIERHEAHFHVQGGMPLSFVHPIAGYGHPEVIEKRPDGTLLVLLKGEGKAKLGPVQESHRPYLVVEAEPIPEKTEIETSQALQYLNIHKHLVRWIGENISEQAAREQFIQTLTGPLEIVGASTIYLIQDPDMQQMILESNDINEKINLLSGVLLTGQLS